MDFDEKCLQSLNLTKQEKRGIMYIKKGGGDNDIFCFGKRNQVSESTS